MKITHKRLLELLDYNPETGVFTWRVQRQCVRAGAIAGTVRPDGYRDIKVEGKTYFAHRLAWFYVHGEWPKGDIDHLRWETDNNRIAKLRDGTTEMNMQNMRAERKSRSGLLGASWNEKEQKWRARITVPETKRRVVLGYFDDPEVAHIVYVMAKRELHPGCTL